VAFTLDDVAAMGAAAAGGAAVLVRRARPAEHRPAAPAGQRRPCGPRHGAARPAAGRPRCRS